MAEALGMQKRQPLTGVCGRRLARTKSEPDLRARRTTAYPVSYFRVRSPANGNLAR
jgi:hypothetical protein